MELITVIMPCYNSDKYIGDAIRSILDQTYSNLELLVLDDGSDDNTRLVVDSFQDNRIKLLVENVNKGIVFQLNKGLNLAQGRYIARMDADDISMPNRFEKQVAFFEDQKNKNIQVLGTDAICIGESNKAIIHQNYRSDQISFLLNFTCPILHPSVMFRGELFSNGLRYPFGFDFAEDFAFWRIIDNGKNIAILPEPLIKYRIHNNQTNRESLRLQIQRDSAVRAALMKPNFFLDRFFLTKKLKLNFFSSTQKVMDTSFLTKKYIKFRKKILGVKNHSLNMFIDQN